MIRSLLALPLLLCGTAAFSAPVTSADRLKVIENSAHLLETRYVDPAAGKRLAQQLRRERKRWDAIDDPKAFADSVTRWMRTEGRDGHLGITYSEKLIPEAGGDAAVVQAEVESWSGPQLNYGVQKVERLEGNVMLLDLRVFPPPDMAGDVIAAAMTLVAQGDALIIDLRRNGGGAETLNLVTGYLLDKGEQPLSGMYVRPTNTLQPSRSPAWVPGRRFGGTKPLYVLTSKRTFSAAEALAYDLQALKRATIVGERTGGGAHPYEYRRVHPHFALDLPESESINPITGSNWEGVGVKPDVAVPADQALETATRAARQAIAKAQPATATNP